MGEKRRLREWAAAAVKCGLCYKAAVAGIIFFFYVAVTCLSRFLRRQQHEIRSCCYDANFPIFFYFVDIPAQVPPLTPGTNKKMTEALKASFASWEKEQERLGIPKGNNYVHIYSLFFHFDS